MSCLVVKSIALLYFASRIQNADGKIHVFASHIPISTSEPTPLRTKQHASPSGHELFVAQKYKEIGADMGDYG